MKKVIIISFCLLLTQYSFSQDMQNEIEKMLISMGGRLNIEVVGENNTYLMDSVSIFCTAVNKNNIYKGMSPDTGEEKYTVGLEHRGMLDQVVKECLSEHIRSRPIDGWDNMTIGLFSDMSGKIEEVTFMYKSDLNIPITDIEKLEQTIKERCRLQFDRNAPALSHVNYMYYCCSVFLKEVCF